MNPLVAHDDASLTADEHKKAMREIKQRWIDQQLKHRSSEYLTEKSAK